MSNNLPGVSQLPDSAIPLKKLIKALLAISFGTIIEW